MIKLYVLLLTLGFFCSCSTNNDESISEAELIGSWKLIEVMADPGDGKGSFQTVESNKTIEFKSNGTVTTNSSLCDPYSEEGVSAGNFSLTGNTITTNCQDPNIETIYFELDNPFLILNFVSNEGYSEKYEKIK